MPSAVTAEDAEAVDIKLLSQYVSRRHFNARFEVDT